jgi:hypothetical protein
MVDEYVYLLGGSSTESSSSSEARKRHQQQQQKQGGGVETNEKQNKFVRPSLFIYRPRTERNKCWWMVFGLRIDLHVDVCIFSTTSRQRLRYTFSSSSYSIAAYIYSPLFPRHTRRSRLLLAPGLYSLCIHRFLLFFPPLASLLATCLSISIDINWYDVLCYMITIFFLFPSRPSSPPLFLLVSVLFASDS